MTATTVNDHARASMAAIAARHVEAEIEAIAQLAQHLGPQILDDPTRFGGMNRSAAVRMIQERLLREFQAVLENRLERLCRQRFRSPHLDQQKPDERG